MTAVTNSFEGITPSGTTITTGNSGGASGTAFDTVTIGAGATLTSSNVQAEQGSLSAAVTPAASQAVYMEWSTALGTLTEEWGRCYVYLTALPAASIRLYAARNGAGAAGSIGFGTAGKIQTFDASNTSVGTGTSVLGLNQWVRYEWHILHSATVGMIEVKLFNSAESGSPTETVTTASTINTSAQATAYRIGQTVSTATPSGLFYTDSFEVNSTGYPGPLTVATTGASVLMATLRRPNRYAAIREFNR